MESFNGKVAVVTGGGTGMGAELVVQLASQGCSVATCDVHSETLAETAKRAANEAPAGARITTHLCDVADAAQVDRFRDDVVKEHETDHINLLFNNAGIGGGGSFLTGKREEWDRVFGIDWGGVYNCARAFVPAARRERRRLPRQHEQRERVLGIARPGQPAHRVLRGEVRGEGLLRGAHRGLPGERAAREGRRRDAGAHRHRHRVEQPPRASAVPSPTR